MNHYKQQLEQRFELGLQRQLRETTVLDNGYCTFDGKRMLNLSSNDYLGLNTAADFKARFFEQLDVDLIGFAGSGSSRLLTGNSPLYTRLETAIDQWFGNTNKQSLFYNSGYHANIGILPALTDKKDLILSDKLCHASLLDGIRLSAATHLRFRHNDMSHLASILQAKRHRYRRVFIVTESLFSMDGDVAKLPELIQLKQRYDAMLYLDEAHAIGALGIHGQGIASVENASEHIDVLVCPMGKAMASQGAIVLTHPTLRELLINTSRTLIFTTALPPINLAWTAFVIENMPTLDKQRHHLSMLVRQANERLTRYGLASSESFILPIIIGDNHRTVKLADILREAHVLVFPIRPPTVAKNTARLRLSLTANMPSDEVMNAIDMIGQYLQG